MSTAEVTVLPVAIEHVRITSKHGFAQVRAALEATVPKLDTDIMRQLSNGDQAAIRQHEEHGPALYIFLEREHGALLAIAGASRNAVQYEIGNPITATKMTRHDLGASLYAPLRVTLFETESGEVVFEYDKPSTLFGQFGNAQVTEVGLYLDKELEAALIAAAG